MSDRLGILDRLLAFMDRPWKAVTVLVFVIVLGIGYAVWEKRAEIAEAILTRTVTPRLQPERFQAVALELLRETDADAVMLIGGDLNKNSATNISGYDREGRPWLSMTGARPILFNDFPVAWLIRFLAGQVICLDLSDGGDEMQAEMRLGIRRTCLAPIPPYENILVGGLWAGWKVPLGYDAEAHAQFVLHQAATKLATW